MYGEPRAALLPVVVQLLESAASSDEGRLHVEWSGTDEELLPFARALLRAHAELLLEEAERLMTAREMRWTGPERHEALVRLCLRVACPPPPERRSA